MAEKIPWELTVPTEGSLEYQTNPSVLAARALNSSWPPGIVQGSSTRR